MNFTVGKKYRIFCDPTVEQGQAYLIDPFTNEYPPVRAIRKHFNEEDYIMVVCHPVDYDLLKVKAFGNLNVLFKSEPNKGETDGTTI